MLKAFRQWLIRVLTDPAPDTASNTHAVEDVQFRSTSSMVPFDENLLERSRTQWQFGDWASLAALDRDTLQHHPDRAKLALLAAAGHAQQGQGEQARQFTRLAQDWGCSKKLISQVLISGVHNTLGRAAASGGQQARALQHFGNAIAIGSPGGEITLLAQARTAHQVHQLGLPSTEQTPMAALGTTQASSAQAPSLSQSIDTLSDSLKSQQSELKADLDAQLKKQADELIRVRKFLDSSLTSKLDNATRQIEAAVSLQSYFTTGELPNINTERHSWPVSADFAFYLVQLLETNDYDTIIEFGSGISTVIIAKTLAKMATRRQDKPPVAFVSFDHLEQYYQQTLAQLNQADLADKVQLELAPLQPYTAPKGNTYPYYNCHDKLAKFAQQHPHTGKRLLVLVDGPPAATGKHARYPAAPVVLKYFKGAHIDLLLDDYIRDDEKEIAKLWQEDIAAAKLAQTTTERKLEKDACLIRVQPQPAAN